MADPVVELGPQIGVDRHGKDQDTPVLEHAPHVSEDPLVILDVLDDIKGTDEVEFLIAEWQRADLAWHGEAAARIQALDHRWADVDEMRAGDRQPGPQARADIQARWQ